MKYTNAVEIIQRFVGLGNLEPRDLDREVERLKTAPHAQKYPDVREAVRVISCHPWPTAKEDK